MPYKDKQTRDTFTSWNCMMQRCYNPTHANYKHYAGKGIAVCESWKSFRRFVDDIGLRPEGCVLDRKNNSEGYNAENCRWATLKQSTANRGSTVWVGGERVQSLAAKLGISAAKIYSRLRMGWTAEDIKANPQSIPHGWTRRGKINPHAWGTT